VFGRLRGQSICVPRAPQAGKLPRSYVQKPGAIIISTKRWPIPARIASALANAGFSVAAISPFRSFTARTGTVRRHYSYRVRPSSIIRAIDDWSPDVLICADDHAVRELHRIPSRAANSPKTERATRLVNSIERSLGDPRGYEFTRKNSFGQVAGLAMPSDGLHRRLRHRR
jgi:hypothetical protein